MAEAIKEAVYGSVDLTLGENHIELDLSALPVLAGHLSSELPIEVLERFERLLKAALRRGLRGPVSGEAARAVASFQKEIGLLCKYKSYAIKCASPLGYSIFLQNTGEGFSFQRHIEHKTEVFHILEVLPGGYVFICDYADWESCYERESFAAWLNGEADERYERFRYEPRPGDVFTIDRLGVVHTVVGCVLEEFATVSTDMVDRLHDQNEGRLVPERFTRAYVQERLPRLSFPRTSRIIENQATQTPLAREIAAVEIEGGEMIPLARSNVHATRYIVRPQGATALSLDEERAAALYVAAGAGRVIIADEAEAHRQNPPSIAVSAGDLLMIPAGIHYGFVNDGAQPLLVSEQLISFDVAFR